MKYTNKRVYIDINDVIANEAAEQRRKVDEAATS